MNLPGNLPVVFTALSKQLFYARYFITKFVLEQGAVPINPFTTFDYFLLDTVDRDVVRRGNNTLLARSDELWVFGSTRDGVQAEISQCEQAGRPVRYFAVEENASRIYEVERTAVGVES